MIVRETGPVFLLGPLAFFLGFRGSAALRCSALRYLRLTSPLLFPKLGFPPPPRLPKISVAFTNSNACQQVQRTSAFTLLLPRVFHVLTSPKHKRISSRFLRQVFSILDTPRAPRRWTEVRTHLRQSSRPSRKQSRLLRNNKVYRHRRRLCKHRLPRPALSTTSHASGKAVVSAAIQPKLSM